MTVYHAPCGPPAPPPVQGAPSAPPPGPLLLPAPTETTLVTDRDAIYAPTARRDCGPATAVARGLAEYLLGAVRVELKGRQQRLINVFHFRPDPEIDVAHPSAAVVLEGQGDLDATGFAPVPLADLGGETRLVQYGEFAGRFSIQVVANDPQERATFEAGLLDALVPVEWMGGFRLVLPHYHGLVMECETPPGLSLPDAADQVQRHERVLVVPVRASVAAVRLFQIPAGRPQLRLESIGPDVDLSTSG